jgi:hypothetical protein
VKTPKKMVMADMIHRGFFAETATLVSQLRAREELIVLNSNSKSSKNTAIKGTKQKKLSKSTKSHPEVSSNGKKNTNNIVDAKTNNQRYFITLKNLL